MKYIHFLLGLIVGCALTITFIYVFDWGDYKDGFSVVNDENLRADESVEIVVRQQKDSDLNSVKEAYSSNNSQKSNLGNEKSQLENDEVEKHDDDSPKLKINTILNNIVNKGTGDINSLTAQEALQSEDFDNMVIQITGDNSMNISYSEAFKQKLLEIVYKVDGIEDVAVGCSKEICMMKVIQDNKKAWDQFSEVLLTDNTVGNVFIGVGDRDTKVVFSRILDAGVELE